MFASSRPRPSSLCLLIFSAVLGFGAITAPVPSGAATEHVVEPGDTLSHIAVATGYSVAELQQWNSMNDSDRIRVGQRLTIGPASITHTVRFGDTLSQIAARHGVATAQLAAANGIADIHGLGVGTVLTVPGSTVLSDQAPVDIAAYPNIPDRLADRPERLALIPVFERWSEANGLPVDLVMAVAYHESGWNQDALSSAGALGVGQLMPVTADWVATYLIGRPALDRRDAEDNIRISARYLRWLLDRFDGDERLALGGYFQGPTSVARGEWLAVTDSYVANVAAQRSRFVGR